MQTLPFGLKVETIGKLAQWRIDSLAPSLTWKSNCFRIGSWNWRLQMKKSGPLHVWLFRESAEQSNDIVASVCFVFKVLYGPGLRQTLKSADFEKQFRLNDYQAWSVEVLLPGKFILEIEFLEMKTRIQKQFASERPIQLVAQKGVLSCLKSMLVDGLYTDVTITTPHGNIGAHLVVLAARSRVFQAMFSHDLQERKTLTIDMKDMSLDALKALLSYLYGNIGEDSFHVHRLALLRAADKYEVNDLKQACEQSLIEDLNMENVLERLENSWLYHLTQLKEECIRFLFDFGKVYEIRKEFHHFLKSTDKELIIQMFQEGLNAHTLKS